MGHYSIEPKCQVFVIDYGLLFFAKSKSKNIDKNINENLSGKYNPKRLDYAKRSGTDAPKTVLKTAKLKKQ